MNQPEQRERDTFFIKLPSSPRVVLLFLADLIFLLLITATRTKQQVRRQEQAGQVPCLPASGGMESAGRKRGRDGGDREDAAVGAVNGSGNGGGGNQRPRRRNRFAPVAPAVDEVSGDSQRVPGTPW